MLRERTWTTGSSVHGNEKELSPPCGAIGANAALTVTLVWDQTVNAWGGGIVRVLSAFRSANGADSEG